MATTLKAIDKKIATFIVNRDKLKVLAHDTAMMIFDHAMAHSDCTRAIKLATALPNSWQPQMEAWFKAFSPIRVIIKNDKCELSPDYKKASLANKPEFWDREAALATPFYDLMEEPKVDKILDFAALVAMVERIGKQIDKKIEEGKVKPEDIESAKAISARVGELRFTKVKPEPVNENTADTPVEESAAA